MKLSHGNLPRQDGEKPGSSSRRAFSSESLLFPQPFLLSGVGVFPLPLLVPRSAPTAFVAFATNAVGVVRPPAFGDLASRCPCLALGSLVWGHGTRGVGAWGAGSRVLDIAFCVCAWCVARSVRVLRACGSRRFGGACCVCALCVWVCGGCGVRFVFLPRGPNDQKNLIPIEIFDLDRNF